MNIYALSDTSNLAFDAIREGQRPADIAFLFRVVGDGGLLGDFTGVDGMGRTVEPYEYAEGGKNDGQHVLPGPVKLGRITLRWGMMDRSALHDWCRAVEVGRGARQDLLVMQLTRAGAPLRIYAVSGAWPVSWRGAPLDATQSQVPIEEIELAYSDLEMVVVPDAL